MTPQVMITPVAFSSIGWKTYIIFAVFNAVSIPVTYFCYPETCGRSLEEMDLIFSKSQGIYDTVKLAQSEPLHYGRHGEVLRELLPEVAEQLGDSSQESMKGTTRHAEAVEDN